MKTKRLIFALAIVLIVKCTIAQNSYDYLIFPDTASRIILVGSDQSINSKIMSGRKLQDSSYFAKRLFLELNIPYHQSVIRLNQCSRNFSANYEGPNVLYISENEGGFPRKGIAIQEGNQMNEYLNLNYVDLLVWDDQFEFGAIDIFSHELGHVMMNNIFYKYPDYKCRKQHVSMGVTDYNLAFFEGWGIHFQRLAFDKVNMYRNGFNQQFKYHKTSKIWHSNIDEKLRINGVLSNEYIYQKLMPLNAVLDSMTIEEAILTEHTSTIFDYSKLKNAQQMLSCEGVLATLFYRINTNDILQNSYKEKKYYEKFLISPIPFDVSPKDIFSPFENVVLKNFWVWQKIKDRDFNKKNITIEFIKEWCESFPEDKQELIKVFISTTIGKTVNDELGDLFEKMSWYGSIGDYDLFIFYNKEFKKKYAELNVNLLSDNLLLENNIGPELWIENREIHIKTTLWDAKDKLPLYININTASEYEIATFFEMNFITAKAFVSKRNEIGYFKSFQELEKFDFSLERLKY